MPEVNSLDLNNLPEEYGKHAAEESSTTTATYTEPPKFNKKKSSGKDESAKVYECRFCSLKFSKSQALGGHMNRHRQERETETLYRARQLVYSNEGFSGAAVHFGGQTGYSARDLIPPAGFEISGGLGCAGDHCVPFRPLYPRFPAAAPLHPSVFPSTSPSHPIHFSSSYPAHPPMGQVLHGISQRLLHGHSYGSHSQAADEVRPPPPLS
ncbi:hypothetical protein HPP92_004806 [Vanilla planifolia]|uniref:C2H2-type domain-containing protein n=1 Tax=Vanilla planifolia TaxID=51239 RepID=A0A835VBI6_VANPL|nr:hypothetical protein HPP92_004806 [Vanilla planifolia]